jgi:hypothetical protein
LLHLVDGSRDEADDGLERQLVLGVQRSQMFEHRRYVGPGRLGQVLERHELVGHADELRHAIGTDAGEVAHDPPP